MTNRPQNRVRPRSIVGIFVALLMLLAACAEPEPDEPEIVDDPPSEMADGDCFLDMTQSVAASASMPGFVGDADVSSDCGGDIDSQTLTVCIQVSAGDDVNDPPNPDAAAIFPNITCAEEIGSGLVIARPNGQGLAGNNWYRHWAQVETSTGLFFEAANGWTTINCLDADPNSCLFGFLEEPMIEDPVIEDPVIEDPVIDDPVIDDPIIDDPIEDDPILDDPGIGDGGDPLDDGDLILDEDPPDDGDGCPPFCIF